MDGTTDTEPCVEPSFLCVAKELTVYAVGSFVIFMKEVIVWIYAD